MYRLAVRAEVDLGRPPRRIGDRGVPTGGRLHGRRVERRGAEVGKRQGLAIAVADALGRRLGDPFGGAQVNRRAGSVLRKC